jgi:2-polyprenyl-3-methyl-5-hydroxy-6-metoxy-1,4-benzoquinol methylase
MSVIIGNRDDLKTLYNGESGELHPYKKDFYSNLKHKLILDMGCGAGTAARFLAKQQNTIYGVTFSEEEAEISMGVMQEVLVADLDVLRHPPFQSIKFDVVLLGDVLEHLKYPYSLLCLARKSLKEEGLLYVTVPNVANIIVRIGLLFGRFTYDEYGILDKTHLRFFTIDTITKTVTKAGFSIDKLTYSNWSWRLVPKVLYKFRGIWRVENILKKLLTNLSPGLFSTQIMLIARPFGDRQNVSSE